MLEAVSSGFLLATELADYLVKKGVPFRESHAIVGNLVGECIAKEKDFSQLTKQDLLEASPLLDSQALKVLTPRAAIDQKNIIGGTATKRVAAQIKTWKKRLRKP